MLAHLTVHEPPPPPDGDTPLAFSMEGYRGPAIPSLLISQFCEPGWHSNQALNKYQEEVGGPLKDEWPGVRLFEANASANPSWFDRIPKPFYPQPHQWLLMPMTQLFGSDELSRRSPSITERIPAPHVSLAPADGAMLNIHAGDVIRLALQGRVHQVAVRLDPVTPRGTVGVFLPEVAPATLPAWIDVERAVQIERRAA